jgi:hypothetical protein
MKARHRPPAPLTTAVKRGKSRGQIYDLMKACQEPWGGAGGSVHFFRGVERSLDKLDWFNVSFSFVFTFTFASVLNISFLFLLFSNLRNPNPNDDSYVRDNVNEKSFGDNIVMY